LKGNTGAHLALFGANLIYGLNYTIAKDVMPTYIEPLGFILLRVSGAALLFWLLLLNRKWEKVAWKDLGRMAILALFGVAANQLLFFSGLNLTTPINAAIIMTSNPILVLLMSAIIIRERLTLLKILGIIIGASGAILLLTVQQEGQVALMDSNYMLGNLLIFLNATAYAIYLVLVKPIMNKYSPFTVIRWMFTFGLIYVTPIGWKQFNAIEWSEMPPAIIGATAYVVIGTTFLAYLLNIIAIKKVNPSTVSTYIYLQPLLAAIYAIAIGADSLNTTMIISAALIFTGVYFVAVRKKQKV
jgi:drug/metabolite transporter (DMT)-like permease